MRTEQISAEWKRAAKALQAADTLLSEGLTEDAVSRAYYAVLHAARAALLVHDQAAKTQVGVARLFGQALVEPGELEREWGRILTREQDQRAKADYNVDVEIGSQVANELLSDAHRFVERMAAYLESNDVVLPHAFGSN